MGRFNQINLHNQKKNEKIVKELTLMMDNIFYNKEDNEKKMNLYFLLFYFIVYIDYYSNVSIIDKRTLSND